MYARACRAGSLVVTLLVALACGADPRARAVLPAPAVELEPVRPLAPPPEQVTSKPLGACELAEELPIALGQFREAGDTPDRPVDEPAACAVGAPAPRASAKLFRITAESTLRFWATGGPYPDLSGLFPDVVLTVVRGCPGEPGSTVVACGETIAEDLPEGKYFVTAVRASAREQGEGSPTGAFAYRVAAPGDTQCPEQLATRRIDDWMGESIPRVVDLGDLNGDSRSDPVVEYRAASNALSTRVLAADDYPGCLRTVLDDSVTVTVQGGKSGGWKHLRTSGTAAPGAAEGDLVVAHRATYDAKLRRYVKLVPLGCSAGASPGAKSVPCPPLRSSP